MTEVDPPAKVTDEIIADDPGLDFDFGEKRKKKKKRDKKVTQIIDGTGQTWRAGERYDYTELLDRIHKEINAFNPNLSESKKFKVTPPTVQRVGSRRVSWTNFAAICQNLDRQQDHIMAFVLTELGTTGSLANGGQHLVLKGRYNQKHIENLLRKYIQEYVACTMCRSANTSLIRDNATRLYDIKCQACGASRSVTPINKGFQAVGRGERRAARNAAT